MPAGAQDNNLPQPAYARSTAGLLPLLGQDQEPKALAALTGSTIDLGARSISSAFKGLIAVEVSVKNNSDRPVIFKGNEAKAGTGELKASPMSEISNRIQQRDNPRGYCLRSLENTITAALTLGAVQTVEGEMIKHGPIAERYGFDNVNRLDRLARFGERILWPGDASQGIIYFPANESLSGRSIQMPVADFYNHKDAVTVSAPIQ